KPEVKIVVTYPDGLTREGDNLDLTCIAEGKPHPYQINWLRVEEDVPPHAVVTGSDLYIENLNKSYNGTYRCVASNAVGEAYDDYILYVYDAPTTIPTPTTNPVNTQVSPSNLLSSTSNNKSEELQISDRPLQFKPQSAY
ncbi:Cell adhesion molecule 1, partial [Characodon lateralis]|nr:Cell adhesion molecule 1 [Characodon lateralis]